VVVLDYPKVGGKPSRPKELLDEVQTDWGFDLDATRVLLRWPGNQPHVAKRAPHAASYIASE
jgi:hypothetical protein